jgi:periplasmic copper chaperone A
MQKDWPRAVALVASLSALMASACTQPQEPATEVGELTVSRAIVRAGGVGDSVAGYVAINNAGSEDRLLAVSCVCAERAELHATNVAAQQGGATATFNPAMEVLESIGAPAGGEVEIAPGSPYHLMLLNLTTPLAPGQSGELVLTFERAGVRTTPFVTAENTRAAWSENGGQ